MGRGGSRLIATVEIGLELPERLLTTGATALDWPGGLFVFVSLYDGKPNEALDALRYMQLCKKVNCQTVHGQPQDRKGCGSRLVPEEWG